MASEASLHLRFALSRGALDRFAREVMATAPAEPELSRPLRRRIGWVGLFAVEEVWRTESRMRFAVEGTGFLDRGGFAYFPTAAVRPTGRERRPDPSAHEYEAFDGSWLLWNQDL